MVRLLVGRLLVHAPERSLETVAVQFIRPRTRRRRRPGQKGVHSTRDLAEQRVDRVAVTARFDLQNEKDSVRRTRDLTESPGKEILIKNVGHLGRGQRAPSWCRSRPRE